MSGGLFSSSGSGSGFSFGQPQNGTQSSNQNSQFSSNPPKTAGGLFAPSATNNATFGNANNATAGQANGGPSSSGLFGNSNLGQPAQSSFGKSASNPNTPAAQPAGGLFGNAPSTPVLGQQNTGNFNFGGSNAPPTTSFSLPSQAAPANGSGTLFGNKQQNSNPSIFGNNQATASASGTGIFGNNQNTSSTNGSFGVGSQNSTGLFGKPTTASAPNNSNGLFGANSQSTTGSSLFGNSQGSGIAGSFGNGGAASTSLFGKPSAGPSTGSSQLFGNNQASGPPQSNLFGKPASSAMFNGQMASNRLIATIDQPSYVLPGRLEPSPKLYSSLTAPALLRKESKNLQSSNVVPVPSRTLERPKPVQKGRASTLEPATKKPRTWINSYESYVRDRPTSLLIRRSNAAKAARFQHSPTKLLGSAATKLLSTATDADDTANQSAEISLFHKQPTVVNLVKVSKSVLESGYFIRPHLDELVGYSKQQLQKVSNLVIGREGYGQLSYSQPVDLSNISNLGDILNGIVVFFRGGVSVYNDDANKPARGQELNVPCTVTIENAFPLDANRRPILDMNDPRMEKHIAKLRKVNANTGAEFITFAHGVWVFKVPHFSFWGIREDDMVIDDEDAEDLNVHRTLDMDRIVEFATEPVAENTKESEDAQVDVRMDSPLVEEISDQLPPFLQHEQLLTGPSSKSWVDILSQSQILAASEAALAKASEFQSKVSVSDLSDMLYGDSAQPAHLKHKRPHGLFTSRNFLVRAATSSGVKLGRWPKAATLDTAWLQPWSSIEEPSADHVPKRTTELSFANLSQRSSSQLWQLGKALFDETDDSSRRKRLLELLGTTKDAPSIDAQDDFDIMWALIREQRLEEATKLAVTSGNPVLATIIPQVGDLKARSTAKSQLDEWKTSGKIFSVPVGARKIFELAAGNVPVIPAYSANGKTLEELDLIDGLGWSDALRFLLQFSPPETPVSGLIQSLPDSSDQEYRFLKAFADPDRIGDLLALLDAPTAFVALLAIGYQADTDLLDRVVVPLAFELLRLKQPEDAVFVAMHINKDGLRQSTVRAIVSRSPDRESSHKFLKLHVPPSWVAESQALRAHYLHDYVKEATILVNSGSFDKAHRVLVSKVAPQSVISETLGSIVELLRQIPTTVPDWTTGAKLYVSFADFKASPSAALAKSLCFLLQNADTPTVEIRAAVSLMAGYVASTGESSLSTSQVLKMKLSTSQFRQLAIQRSAIDF